MTERNITTSNGSQRRGRTAHPHASEVDFSTRLDPADLPEWMDEPCSYEQFRGCVRDIGRINRWTLAYRPTLRFVRSVLRKETPSQGPLRVLDVGSGGGDTLRRLSLWALRQGRAVALTGMDLNPHATRAATEFSAGDPRFRAIGWRTGDVFTQTAAGAWDVVLSALVTHHMSDAEIVDFLRWMESTAIRGWFINDLVRSRKAYRLFSLWTKLTRWHPFVRHDGLVSIRRSFRAEDWQRLLKAASIPLDAVRIESAGIGRLCVSRVR